MNMSGNQSGTVAVFVGPGQPFDIRKYPVYPPPAGQARLALVRSGICGTDVHIFQGRLPLGMPELVIGHEFIGTIEALAASDARDARGALLRVGDTCIACAALPCGECLNCRNGETASCLRFRVAFRQDPNETPHFYGGFGEYVFSNTGNLIRIPEHVNLDAVAAFPCAGPTGIRAFAYGGGARSGEIVVVQGTGPVGLFAIAWATQAGCTVVAIGSGSNPERLQLAERLGAKAVFDIHTTTREERLDAIIRLAKGMDRGNGADLVFEASGAPSAVPEGIELIRTRGRYLIPGQYSTNNPVEIRTEKITFKAITIVGSGQYTLGDVATYLDFLQDLPDLQDIFAACITHRYAISEADQALQDASQGRSIKGVFVR